MIQSIPSQSCKLTKAMDPEKPAVSANYDQAIWAPKMQAIAQHQDRKAFAELFNNFAPLIKGFLMRSKNAGIDEQLAEEIVQETLLKVWRNAASYNPEKSKVSTWIYTIARNCRIDSLRKINFQECSLEVEDIWPEQTEDETPLHHLQQQRSEQAIQEQIKHLSDDQRQVLFKSFMEGKSHSEISQDLNLPLGTVKSRVRLAMQKLSLVLDR